MGDERTGMTKMADLIASLANGLSTNTRTVQRLQAQVEELQRKVNLQERTITDLIQLTGQITREGGRHHDALLELKSRVDRMVIGGA